MDQTTQQYIPYIEFELSENSKTTIDLPEVKLLNRRELVLSDTWKVIIRHSLRRRLQLDRYVSLQLVQSYSPVKYCQIHWWFDPRNQCFMCRP